MFGLDGAMDKANSNWKSGRILCLLGGFRRSNSEAFRFVKGGQINGRDHVGV